MLGVRVSLSLSTSLPMSHSQSWFQHEGIEVTLTQDPQPKSPVADLKFGAEYSDHMLLVNWTKDEGWDTPKIVPYGNLSLSPALSALHYSTEVWSIKYFSKSIFYPVEIFFYECVFLMFF